MENENKKLNKKQQKVVTENLKLAYKIAWSYVGRCSLNKDELIQIASVGLIKAVIGYKEEKGVFSTYAFPVIRGAIQDAIKKEQKEEGGNRNNKVRVESYIADSGYDKSEDPKKQIEAGIDFGSMKERIKNFFYSLELKKGKQNNAEIEKILDRKLEIYYAKREWGYSEKRIIKEFGLRNRSQLIRMIKNTDLLIKFLILNTKEEEESKK